MRGFWRDFATLDNALHMLAAGAICWALSRVGMEPGLVVILNAAGWYLREVWQRWIDSEPLFDGWKRRKHLEWISPSMVGLIVAGVSG